MPRFFLAIFSLVFLFSCSLKNSKQVVVYTKQYAQPNKLILETKIKLEGKNRAKFKNSDLLIWSLFDSAKGEIISAGIAEQLKWPHSISVKAKDLKIPIQNSTEMVFSARLVHQGDEFKAPKNGQLAGFISASNNIGGTSELVLQ